MHQTLLAATKTFNWPASPALGYAKYNNAFREGDGEARWKVIGEVDGQLYTAVHVWRGDVIRYISVRRSNAGEDRLYRGAASRPE